LYHEHGSDESDNEPEEESKTGFKKVEDSGLLEKLILTKPKKANPYERQEPKENVEEPVPTKSSVMGFLDSAVGSVVGAV